MGLASLTSPPWMKRWAFGAGAGLTGGGGGGGGGGGAAVATRIKSLTPPLPAPPATPPVTPPTTPASPTSGGSSVMIAMVFGILMGAQNLHCTTRAVCITLGRTVGFPGGGGGGGGGPGAVKVM